MFRSGFALGPLLLLVPVLFWLAGSFVLYWVVRLGVRHGVLDTRRRGPGARADGTDPGPSGGGL